MGPMAHRPMDNFLGMAGGRGPGLSRPYHASRLGLLALGEGRQARHDTLHEGQVDDSEHAL